MGLIIFIVVYVLVGCAIAYMNYRILWGDPEICRLFTVVLTGVVWPLVAWLTIYCVWQDGLRKPFESATKKSR